MTRWPGGLRLERSAWVSEQSPGDRVVVIPHHFQACSAPLSHACAAHDAVRPTALRDRAANGRRYVRWHQLEVIANARGTRLIETGI